MIANSDYCYCQVSCYGRSLKISLPSQSINYVLSKGGKYFSKIEHAQITHELLPAPPNHRWLWKWLTKRPLIKKPILSTSSWRNLIVVNHGQSSSTSCATPLVAATANHPCRCYSNSTLLMVPQSYFCVGSRQQVCENWLTIRALVWYCFLMPSLFFQICMVKEAIL